MEEYFTASSSDSLCVLKDRSGVNLSGITKAQLNRFSVEEKVREYLFSVQDKGYQAFQQKLIPTVSADTIIGVRVPILRELAKEIVKEGEAQAYLEILPHRYLEEYILHGCIINMSRDYDEALRQTERYLPWVDNWCTCDLLAPKVFKKHLPHLSQKIDEWIASPKPFTIRFGMETRMRFYLDEAFESAYLEQVAQVKSDELYVRLMIAWFFATALAKQYDAAVPYLERHCLDKWTHNKTIQKSVESYRITPEQKQYLKRLRV